jgi:methyl acetate hydrolase
MTSFFKDRFTLAERADSVLRAAVASDRVPGVVAALTDDTATIYAGAASSAAMGPNALGPDTVMKIYSMTKPLTSVAALQLVEQGKLSLDEPAAKHLPALAELKILTGFDAGGAPQLRAPTRPVTLRQLLNHTSGFTYDMWDSNLDKYYAVRNLPRQFTKKMAAMKVPIAFEPGEQWGYGIGLDWVGFLVEAASGQKLSEYFKQHITGPLGMHSTEFEVTPEMQARKAKMHSRTGTGKVEPLHLTPPENPEFEAGGSGLYSTANDYLKFLRMILNRGKVDGRQLLNPESIDLMSRNTIGNFRVAPMRTAIPHLSCDAEFFPDTPKTWSLAFMINETQAPTGRSAGSMGWAGLANTYFWIDPSKGIAGLALMQLLPFADPQALGIFYDFEKSVYASLQ